MQYGGTRFASCKLPELFLAANTLCVLWLFHFAPFNFNDILNFITRDMLGGRFLRRLVPGRRFKRVFLYSLPLTWHALFFGITDGLITTYLRHARVYDHTRKYIRERELDATFNSFSVPGAIKFSDFPIAPFHLAPLKDDDWFLKLNLTKPDEDFGTEVGIDRSAQLDDLRQEIDPSLSSPTTHWVWATELPFILMPWDAAFDQLIQYHYVHPPAENASLSYVDCISAGFLCGVWSINTPTLLRFSVDEVDDLNQDSEPQYSERGYVTRPVTVRIVELGLKHFRPGVFPTLFDQLLFYTSGECDPQSIPEYDLAGLINERAWEFTEQLCEAFPPFAFMHKVDDWMGENLPTSVDMVINQARVLVMMATWLVLYVPVGVTLTIWEEFAGFA